MKNSRSNLAPILILSVVSSYIGSHLFFRLNADTLDKSNPRVPGHIRSIHAYTLNSNASARRFNFCYSPLAQIDGWLAGGSLLFTHYAGHK